MFVIAAVPTQPRLTVHDAKIEALRILVVFAKYFGGHCKGTVGRPPRRHPRFGRGRLLINNHAQIGSSIRWAQQQALVLGDLEDLSKHCPAGKTQVTDRTLRDHHRTRWLVVKEDILYQGFRVTVKKDAA